MKSTNQRLSQGHVPFVRFLLALLAGIGAGIAMPPEGIAYRILFGLAALCALVFVVLFVLPGRRSSAYLGWMGLFWLGLLLFSGWLSVWRTSPRIDKRHFSRHDSEMLVGFVADEPVVRGTHVRFPFTVTSGYENDTLRPLTGKLMLTIRVDSSGMHDFSYGQTIAIPSNFDEVAPPYNPGELDYRRHLANKNIWHQVYVRDVGDVQLLSTFQGNRLVSFALELRKRMVNKFGRYLADPDAHSIASTLILGYRADLTQDLLNAFSTTGTIHVLSVSGMHVVIVFWLLSKLLWWMDEAKVLRLARWAILLACVWAYALITGFSPSVLRASIMISFVITASHFSRQARVFNSIAASAFFLLLYEPKFVLDVGFQLSYLAVIFIVFLMPLLQQAFPINQRFARPIWDYSLMSISAQAGAFPLATFYFNQFPVYFLPANLLVVLPASLIMYLGFGLLLMPLEGVCQLMGIALEWLILFMNNALRHIEQLPMSSVRGVWLESWEFVVMYGLMLAVAFAGIRKRKNLVYVACACLVLLSSSSFVSNNQKVFARQLVIYNVRTHFAIGIMHRGKVILYSSLPSLDDRTIQYSVMPHLEYYTALSRIDFVPQDSVFNSASVVVHDGVVQWEDKRLFIYDGDPKFEGVLPVDILLIRQNPLRPLTDIVQTLPCELLILDGSNYDTSIEKMLGEADSLAIPTYVLKNNFAYVWPYSE